MQTMFRKIEGVGKYKEKDVVKNNKGENCKVEGQTSFVTLFRDENQLKLFQFTKKVKIIYPTSVFP